MIKKFYFLTTLLSIATSRQCHAMKNNLLVNNNDVPIQQATILAKITAVEKPEKALYLTPHHALITGKNKCSVIDIKTNKEIKKIYDKYHDKYDWASDISVHPNLKKFAFSSDSNENGNHNLTIYNAITYNAECTIKCDSCIDSFHFIPLDTTIAICLSNSPNVILWNYETNTSTLIDSLQSKVSFAPSISFHPTKPLMFFAWENLYSFNLKTPKKTKLTTGGKDCHNFLECSPDGLFIARGTQIKIFLTSLDPASNNLFISESDDNWLANIAIHPNSKILITLSKSISEQLYTLGYWNINRSELISATTVPSAPHKYHNRSSLSISPNGAKLLLVLNNECMEIAIPFEARYKDLTKNAGVFAYFALQHYLHNGTNQLIPDIKHHLITTLLKASEY